MSKGLQRSSQIIGIVERPIVDQGNFSAGINVWVSIFIRLTTMGGPSSMRDPNGMTRRGCGMFANQFNRIGLVTVTGKFRNDLVERETIK